MHTLVVLSSVLLVVLGAFALLQTLRTIAGPHRRLLQALVLTAPLVSLALGLAGLHHFAGRECFLTAPRWDVLLAVALPVGMGTAALAGLGLGVGRHVLLGRVLAQSGQPAGPGLRALADGLAAQLGVPPARLLVCPLDQPLALTYGLRRPTVLLSAWMLAHLDRQEQEAVLAHELAHAARRDYLAIWLATILRDAFCYLPTSWAAFAQFQREKEPAADDLAAGATRRPLALASALAKVWHQTTVGPVSAGAPALVGSGEAIKARVERLLAPSGPPRARHSRLATLGIGFVVVAGLLSLQVVSVALLLLPMGCGPLRTLGVTL